MSSFVVDKAVIAYLVEAIHYYESYGSHLDKSEIGQILWCQNVKAVMRPGDSVDDLPRRIGDEPFGYEHPRLPLPPLVIKPLEVLRAIGILEYQCIDDHEYRLSDAATILHELMMTAVFYLPGYCALHPGAPKCWQEAVYPQKEAQSCRKN